MITPARRMWLYPIDRDSIEIVILGDDSIARTYADIKSRCETWPGWGRVDVLVNASGAVLGLRVSLSPVASSDDPIAEALRMLRAIETLRWSGGGPSDSAIGMVATW